MFASRMLRLAACLCAAALSPVQAATELQAGTTSGAVTLDPGETREFFIDVPEGATHLELLLESARAMNEDVDLFLRFAEPFDPESSPFSQALYYAVGDTGLEHLEVTFASSPPVSPGRWYVLVVNAHPELKARNTELTASIRSEAEPTLEPLELDIVYTDPAGFGFNDNAPFPGQGGNNAATLGEARRAAFETAVAMLQESFTSPVAVTVDASFEAIEEDEDGGAPLAFAGPNFADRDFPGARASNTWYVSSIIPRLAGTDTCRVTNVSCKGNAEADMRVVFNTDPPGGWWYGFDRDFGRSGTDFIAVAVHEMLHGLGFLSLADVETGQLATAADGTPRTDAYTAQVVWDKDGEFVPVDELTDKQRVEAFTSLSQLLWSGEKADAFWEERRFQTGSGCITCVKPPLYAPSNPNPGSSVSHVNFSDIMFWRGDSPTNNRNINIREGGPALGAAWAMLRDAGWDEDSKPKLEGAMAPELGMWFDKARDGHGFDLQRTGDTWFLTFFSYGDDETAEWLLGIGKVQNGVFTGDLERFTFDAADSPPQTGTKAGSAVIDFTATSASEACDDGTDRSDAVQLAQFEWTIDGESGAWCVQPLIASTEPTPPPDFSGHWWAGDADQGWGLTIYQQGLVLFAVLYYYDADGNPRWVLGSSADWSNGETITMEEFDGFCRTCAPEELTSSNAGTLVLTLNTPTQGDGGGNTATVDVAYQGPEGGKWERNAVPIKLISDPAS